MSRLFLAVPAVMEGYEKLQEQFAPLVRGRWTPPERLHLTLLFLGERFDAEWLIERIGRESIGLAPPPLRGLGYFRRNRILFARTGNASLQRLYDTLCRAIGQPTETLEPHVTLMRFKGVREWGAFKATLREYETQSLGRLEPKLILYRSQLRPEGPLYTVLKEWPL